LSLPFGGSVALGEFGADFLHHSFGSARGHLLADEGDHTTADESTHKRADD
jgi:hypothetical protein